MNDSASAVTSDGRSLILNGKRRLIISGEIHYARVPRAEWARVLDRSKEAGINCVASYVFWGVHEPREGVYDFSGNADLGAFIELCRERDMAFIVRMGPYICAEWNYGGFPAWLRDVPDIVIRTWNEPYVERVKKYFRMLVAHIRPHLATNGGNVVLVQVENEYNNISKRYGENGSRYLTWGGGLCEVAGDRCADGDVRGRRAGRDRRDEWFQRARDGGASSPEISRHAAAVDGELAGLVRHVGV